MALVLDLDRDREVAELVKPESAAPEDSFVLAGPVARLDSLVEVWHFTRREVELRSRSRPVVAEAPWDERRFLLD